MRAGQKVGHYTVVGELGRGGMGAVFEAEDTRLRRTVALKVAREGTADETARRRLLREARAAAAVNHPNLAAVYEVGEVDGAVFIAMELIDGVSLRARLEQGPVELREALRIARDLAAGLAHLHRAGVIHRDLKPDNVLLDGEGRVRLVDFGIAKVRAPAGEADATVTREGELVGTPSYMSPEQAEGRSADERSDVFALGAVLYEVASGRRAFSGSSAIQVLASVLRDDPPPLAGLPGDLVRVIERCLEKDPSDRWSSVEQVAEALAQVRVDGPIEVATAVAPRPARRWPLFAGAVIAVTAAGAGALLLLRGGRATDAPAAWQPLIVEMPELYEQNVTVPAVSPDGTLVAYLSDRADRGRTLRIYVEPIDATVGPSRSLSSPSGGSIDLRWTPDGRALLDSGPLGLFRVPVDGEPPVKLRPESFSADACGDRIASFEPVPSGCEGCFRVVLFGADQPERELVRLGPREYPRRVRCDAAGGRAIVDVWRPDKKLDEIHVLDVAAPVMGPAIFRTNDQQAGWPTFGPDGTTLITARGRGLQTELLEMSLDGARVHTLVANANLIQPDVARDGARLVFTTGQTSFALAADAKGSSTRPIGVHFVAFYGLQLSPDGAMLVATRVDLEARRDVFAYPTDGSAPSGRKLGPGRPWGVTPDGREVIATQWADDGTLPLVAYPLAGGTPRRLATLAAFPRDVRLGADGRIHLTVQHGGGFEARSLPLTGGELVAEAAPPNILVVPMAEGYRLVEVGVSEIRSELHVVPPGEPLDSARARVVFAKAYVIDGANLVYRPAGDPALRRLDVRTGSEESVGLTARNEFEFAISPDGRTVYSPIVDGRSRLQIITNFASRPRP